MILMHCLVFIIFHGYLSNFVFHAFENLKSVLEHGIPLLDQILNIFMPLVSCIFRLF